MSRAEPVGPPQPPDGASQAYRDGWADGLAGSGPDPARLAYGANRLNDYERGYLESGTAEGEQKDAVRAARKRRRG